MLKSNISEIKAKEYVISQFFSLNYLFKLIIIWFYVVIQFENADLTQVQFFKTSLNHIDVSDSVIEGIGIVIEDIRGASLD